MNDLIAKLAELFSQQKPPVPSPNEGIDLVRPWDSPVLRPPMPVGMGRLSDQDMLRLSPEPGRFSDQDLTALLLAQRLKKQKQNAVGAGNMTGLITEPIPR